MIKRFYRADVMYTKTVVYFELNYHAHLFPTMKKLRGVFQEKLENSPLSALEDAGLDTEYCPTIYDVEEEFCDCIDFVTYLNEEGETYYLK